MSEACLTKTADGLAWIKSSSFAFTRGERRLASAEVSWQLEPNILQVVQAWNYIPDDWSSAIITQPLKQRLPEGYRGL